MTSLIVDSSVAVKWFASESGSEDARKLGAGTHELIAPDLVIAEVGNALWKKCVQGILNVDQAVAAMRTLPSLFYDLPSSSALAARALEIAQTIRHPIYDCFYLSLAESERLPVITADTRLLAVAGRLPGVQLQKL